MLMLASANHGRSNACTKYTRSTVFRNTQQLFTPACTPLHGWEPPEKHCSSGARIMSLSASRVTDKVKRHTNKVKRLAGKVKRLIKIAVVVFASAHGETRQAYTPVIAPSRMMMLPHHCQRAQPLVRLKDDKSKRPVARPQTPIRTTLAPIQSIILLHPNHHSPDQAKLDSPFSNTKQTQHLPRETATSTNHHHVRT
jgi:hypothetical protein